MLWKFLKKHLVSEHPDVGIILNNLAVFYQNRKKYLEAKSYFDRAIKIFEKTWGENSLIFADFLERYAYLLVKMRRNRDATTKHNRAKLIRSKIEKISRK